MSEERRYRNYESGPVAANVENEFHVPETQINQLKFVWGLWKKSQGVSQTIYELFDNSPNPYIAALTIIQNCDDFKQAKPSSLSYTVIEELGNWVQAKEYCLNYLLTKNVKLEAFHVITAQNNMSLIKMVCSVYKMIEENHIFIDPIKQFICRKQYKEACQVASYLKLHDYFVIEEFLIPLVLQDKTNVAEEFLSGSFVHQKQLVSFLDNLLGSRNLGNEVDIIVRKYDIPDVKRGKLTHKPLGKLIARLVKMYNLPRETAPNLNSKRDEGALQFIMYKRYVQHSLGKDSFREMVIEATASNPILHREVVIQLNLAGDAPEAAYWAKEFKIPKHSCPPAVQKLLDSSFEPENAEPEENWDDNPGYEYHSLSLPDSQIVLVDDPIKFRAFLLEMSSTDLIGIDAEWKPQFGTRKNGLALVQVASQSKVYILDIVTLASHPGCSWEEAGVQLFGNEKIIKLGFGVSSDLTMMLQSLPGLGRTVQSTKGYLDLTSLWKRLTKEFHFVFPYKAQESGESLTTLVELCLGKRLDKSDQFSNWERRPLRESQIRYAALDAFCLIEVFDILKENAEKQGIPFTDVCLELVSKNKSAVKKGSRGSKSRRNTRTEVVSAEIVRPFEQVIGVSDLKVFCDKGLEGLAQQLRKVGIDTTIVASRNGLEKGIQFANRERRVVIVRGRSIHARISQFVPRGFCYPVSSETAHDQLREVLQHFNVRVRQEDIFSRCKLCNGASFVKVSQTTMKIMKSTEEYPPCQVEEDCYEEQDICTGFSSESDDYSVEPCHLPPDIVLQNNERWIDDVDVIQKRTKRGVKIQLNAVPDERINSVSEFNICEECGRVYWDGSHFDRFINGKMKDIISE